MNEEVLVQNIINDGGVNFNAGKGGGKRRHPQIVNSYGRCADEDDLVPESVRWNFPERISEME